MKGAFSKIDPVSLEILICYISITEEVSTRCETANTTVTQHVKQSVQIACYFVKKKKKKTLKEHVGRRILS